MDQLNDTSDQSSSYVPLDQASDPSSEIDRAHHDLRTPLTGIRVAAEILRDCDDLTSRERRKFAELILANEARLEAAVISYLDGLVETREE